VYGTLREGYQQCTVKKEIERDLHYIGAGMINGLLYDLGKYPGAVEGNQREKIIGDVYRMNNPDRVLEILDQYEGYSIASPNVSEFVRKESKVRLNEEKDIIAWIYWYNGGYRDKILIKNKDYLNYLGNKEKVINYGVDGINHKNKTY